MDRDWPDIDDEWSQQDLHAWVRQMGILPDPCEIVPQGVKFIEYPQPPLTEADKEWALEQIVRPRARGYESLAVLQRARDSRRN